MSSFKTFSSAHTAPGKDRPGDKPKDPPASDKPAAPPKEALTGDMAKYGIARVPVDYYHYGVFRYMQLKDAVAQAGRDVRH